MTSNADQINPLSLNFDEPEDVNGNLDIQTSAELALSSSFGDSLFSGSTNPTSPECSPETSGRFLTAHWQSRRHRRRDLSNAEEPDMSRLDSYSPSAAMNCGQQQYNTSHITSFTDSGTLDDMGFETLFGIENTTFPYQDPIETIEGDQINLESSEQFKSYSDPGNSAFPSSDALNIFPPINESSSLSCESQQVQPCHPLPALSSDPPPISVSCETQEAMTSLGDYSFINPTLSRSLPIREAPSRVCKLCDTKISKGKTSPSRSRANSLSTKTNRSARRTHKMTNDGREKYKAVRIRGACENCRIRKCGCDDTILCKPCVVYFGASLVNNRCREFSLNNISGILLDGKMSWRPGSRTLSRYFSGCSFELGNENFAIPLKLGFGESIREMVRIIYPGNITNLYHHHVVYTWPPNGGDQKKCKRSLQIAFPVELSQEQGLKTRINNHLTVLLLKHFSAFPHYPSQLGLLREVYRLYRSLLAARKQEAYFLHQALRLLILVRISGEVTVDESDAAAQEILGRTFDTPLSAYESTHPCYIRSQLGSVFAELAKDLLSDILMKLEILALKRECSDWHVVFSTFAVLFMAIELVQYQDARIGFHAALDGNLMHSPAFRFSERSQEVEVNGVDILLHLYKVCFGGCNSRIQDEADATPPGEAGQFLAKVRNIYTRSQPYLRKQSLTSIGNVLNMSELFDRLVAKLIMTRPSVS